MSDICQKLKDEMRQDMLQEAKEEEYHECMLRRDYEYALDELGISDIDYEITTLINKLSTYGWDVDKSQIIEQLIEM